VNIKGTKGYVFPDVFVITTNYSFKQICRFDK